MLEVAMLPKPKLNGALGVEIKTTIDIHVSSNEPNSISKDQKHYHHNLTTSFHLD
jgi:hypothetical protein